ncbi:kinesin-like protein KIF20B [Lates japonicus]|uniref:Kinesin-like protein KIF20B n=1 Tax=Lates japonicus TaxID=270547 RepID=A0AAD3NAB9_LATJO|nr:kinesin-like protein KIF20B [Lates japonicus]
MKRRKRRLSLHHPGRSTDSSSSGCRDNDMRNLLIAPPAGRQDSQSSIRSRKEGTLQKIGDFLQSSPTLLGTKAKKMMSLVSGRGDADSAASSSSSSSLSLRAKKNKRKLYRPEISSPMDMPSHPASLCGDSITLLSNTNHSP